MNVVHMYSSILHKYMYIQILTLVVSGYFTPKKEKKRINRETLKKWYFDVFKKKMLFCVYRTYMYIFYILVGFYDAYKKLILCLIS